MVMSYGKGFGFSQAYVCHICLQTAPLIDLPCGQSQWYQYIVVSVSVPLRKTSYCTVTKLMAKCNDCLQLNIRLCSSAGPSPSFQTYMIYLVNCHREDICGAQALGIRQQLSIGNYSVPLQQSISVQCCNISLSWCWSWSLMMRSEEWMTVYLAACM